MKTLCLFLVLFTLLSASAQQNTHRFFVVGNTFYKAQENKRLLDEFEARVASCNFSKTVVHLGNNDGANDVESHLGHLKQFINEKLYVAPGRGEWNSGQKGGKKFLKKLSKADGVMIFPDGGCPSPREVLINDDLVLIIIDTQWWLHGFDRRYSKCELEDDWDAVVQFQDALRRNRDKQIIVAAHNGLVSSGNSGGRFSGEQWLGRLPSTLYRKLVGGAQDLKSPEYSYFREAFHNVLKDFPSAVYVSASDYNFQFDELDGVNFVNCGSFVHSEYVADVEGGFSSQEKGFLQIDTFDDGMVRLSFCTTEGVLWHKNIVRKKIKDKDAYSRTKRVLSDSITIAASNQYQLDKKRYWLMGKNYRNVWATPVRVPVFDISKEHGGLRIIKRGGGQQTRSIRMEDGDGKQYVLRSLEKYVEGALPKEVSHTFAIDFAQDFISSSNPYGALVAAELADIAGVYHTNPKIVYLPKDPKLGEYMDDLAGKLFLYEERPAGNRDDVVSFGRSEDIVNTDEVIDRTQQKARYVVDGSSVLRARLLDLLINDWDRHDDQWRWASFKRDGKTIYRPIPRDRDQAFYKAEGVVPWLVARKWVLPKFQGIEPMTKNISGLAFNARFFDRTFLVAQSWSDWKREIERLKKALGDADIDEAVKAFPAEVYPLCGAFTAEVLKQRLKHLEAMAYELYQFLSKSVQIVGTEQNNDFIIDSDKERVRVKIMSKTRKGGEKELTFDRTFDYPLTKQLFIYGLDGKDEFRLSGDSESKINIALVGGRDKDKVVNESAIDWRRVALYDKGTSKLEGRAIKLDSKFNSSAVRYDRHNFKYSVTSPSVSFGLNPDDGLIIGGGPTIRKFNRFREISHSIILDYAFSSNAWAMKFETKLSSPIKLYEQTLTLDLLTPDFQGNFFGYGNQTVWEVPKAEKLFYRSPVRIYKLQFKHDKWLSDAKKHLIYGAASYRHAEVEHHKHRLVNSLSKKEGGNSEFFRAEVGTIYDTKKSRTLKPEDQFAGSKIFPTKGMRFEAAFNYNFSLDALHQDFQQLVFDWRYYLSFRKRPRIVYAFRLGGVKNWGSYPYYYSAQLGRKQNLRGFWANRFSGHSSLYQNTEVRMRLANFKTYVMNGVTGLTIFNDVGRVWAKGEDSQTWHHGYGIGYWVSPFEFALFSVNFENSKEESIVTLKVNFQF